MTALTAQTATVIIAAAAPQVYDYLADPDNLPCYLCDVIPDAGDPARWAFRVEPGALRLHWQLLAPYRSSGVLDVYGDCSVSQLWLTVDAPPAGWPSGKLRELMRDVLHRIREQIEDDPTLGGRPVLQRTA